MKVKDLKKYIINNDKLISILEEIGCHNIKATNNNYFTCGINDGDNNCSMQVFTDEYIGVKSYTRKLRDDNIQPDLLNLVSYCLNISYMASKSWLLSFLKLEDNAGDIQSNDNISFFRKAIRRKRNEKKKQEQVYYDIDILDRYSNTIHIDLIKKDALIDIDILKKYHVMFDERSERILFPHFKWDDSNKICGIVGRTTNPAFKELNINKYMSMLPTKYDKALNLYGLCWNIDSVKEKDEIIIVEAEKSVMKADMYGCGNTVSVGCHTISKEQKKIILSLEISNITIAFDSDVTDEELYTSCEMFVDYMNVYFIKDNWKLLGEKDSPVDKGIKKWQFLYNHKVKYEKYMLKKLKEEQE